MGSNFKETLSVLRDVKIFYDAIILKIHLDLYSMLDYWHNTKFRQTARFHLRKQSASRRQRDGQVCIIPEDCNTDEKLPDN
jgi:hypothetical protein